jgi:hypothetical protein
MSSLLWQSSGTNDCPNSVKDLKLFLCANGSVVAALQINQLSGAEAFFIS